VVDVGVTEEEIMSEGMTLKAQTVQETMLLPLWGRAKFSRLYPESLEDPRAEEIIEHVAHDFSQISTWEAEYGGLACLVRARRFDDAIKAHTASYPQATVVNLGAGLDTTFSRVDNDQIRWYDLDLPDAVAFRRQFIPETARSTCLARSAFDHGWFDEVVFDPAKGMFIIAGGLFIYFDEAQARDLFVAMAARFPGGEILFDGQSKLGRRIINRRLERIGAPAVDFVLDDPSRQLAAWSPKLSVLDTSSFWHGVRRDPRWSKRTVMSINITDWLETAKFVHARFLP
jgi:O-methyltransferase involved in polyketide biosynthesis